MIISIAAVLGYISSTFFISVWNPLNDLTNPCESPKRDNYSNKSYIKPDPGLCTSNEGGFFNFFFFNTLDNGLGLLFCLHNFVFGVPLMYRVFKWTNIFSLDLIECLKQIRLRTLLPTCAPVSEFHHPISISCMIVIKKEVIQYN